MKKKLSVKIKKHSEQTKTLSELLQIQDFSLICVTGKMASGKNFVTSKLEQDGWQSVDADKLVHIAINDSTEEIRHRICLLYRQRQGYRESRRKGNA